MRRSPSGDLWRSRVSLAAPLNIETDLSAQRDILTPNAAFFVRSHFTLPDLPEATHRLVVDGLVARETSWSLDDLRAMADADATLTMECAGNGRANLDPPVDGVQWVGGAVGTATWQGLRLTRLLEAAGIAPGARHVLLSGADAGERATATGRRVVRFERSLPLEKALAPEVMIAVGMNGTPVPREHGGPVRAVVGGWYGMASVKWLTHITVTSTGGDGYWETEDYSYVRAGPSGERRSVPITQMEPKSQITSPPAGSTVAMGSAVDIGGFAWAGEAAVAEVDLSGDDGATWQPATLLDAARPHGWVRWQATWCPDHAGEVALLARCRDTHGRSQPLTRDRDRGTYIVNEVVPYPITVAG
jgi:DMSO/TMAO reductase YedYZ molybdopterin-dependent catalytic subunit